MAVHVPLSPEAQAESRYLMLSVNNLLKPQDGKPVTVPTQDMILGSYYLTMQIDGEKGEGMYFKDVDEALLAYQNGDLGLHAKIKVRLTKKIDGEEKTRTIVATVGLWYLPWCFVLTVAHGTYTTPYAANAVIIAARWLSKKKLHSKPLLKLKLS